MNHLELVRYLLIHLQLGVDGGTTLVSPDWSIFIAKEPEEPDSCITLYHRPSTIYNRLMIDGSEVSRNSLQVRVRSSVYDSGFNKITSIRNSLLGVYNVSFFTIGTDQESVHSFSDVKPILSLGQDQNSDRYLFTFDTNLLQRI